jgi:L,D-peptidoglycan transpeptidase YkuD (ErfK/YbiS/YcfS/YnhG family)
MIVNRSAAMFAAAAVLVVWSGTAIAATSCPAQLAQARHLVLVTAAGMNDTAATMRLYQRASPSVPWQALGEDEPATVGRAGMAWSQFFLRLARRGEPVKVEGDKRTPAGIYRIGHSFGVLASSRPHYLHVTPDTICVNDPSSPDYNTIASRARVGPFVRAENMSRVLPMYRRGLLVDYPTDAGRRAGSCIFIHVWRSPVTPTAGCIAAPEQRIEALQDFSEGGAVLAVLPRQALDRLKGCLP